MMIASDGGQGGFSLSKTPILAIMLLVLAAMLTFFAVKYCSGSSHLRKARKYYESGNFAGAATEALAEVEKNPQSVDGWVMLGDANEALAEIGRSDVKTYMEHVCIALDAWGRSLSLFHNPNIASKKAALETRTQDIVGPDGKSYGRCANTETP